MEVPNRGNSTDAGKLPNRGTSADGVKMPPPRLSAPRGKKPSFIQRASIPIPQPEPTRIDPRYFSHPVSATLYPMKPSGYNPCFCCEACWCKGRSLVNSSLAVGFIELVIGVTGIIVAVVRYFLISSATPDEDPDFLASKARSLDGSDIVLLDAVPHSKKRDAGNHVFALSKVEHFGLTDSERAQAEDILTYFIGVLASLSFLSGVLLIVSASSRNRGLANISLLFNLLVSFSGWVYVVLMAMYVVVVNRKKGPGSGKWNLSRSFIIDGVIVALLTVFFVFGTTLSNSLYHVFDIERRASLLARLPPPAKKSSVVPVEQGRQTPPIQPANS